MQTHLSPLELVESIAAEFAQQARDGHSHINGFAMPGLPMSIAANRRAIEQLLRLLTQTGLNQVAPMKDGSVLVEALPEKNALPDVIRFGATFSKSDMMFKDAEELRHNLLEQTIGGDRCDELLHQLGTHLVTDAELIGRGVRFYFPLPVIHDKMRKVDVVPDDALRDIGIFLVSNDLPPNRIIQIYSRHAGIELEGAPTGNESIIELARWGREIQILAVAPPIDDMTPCRIAETIRHSDLSHLKMLYIAPWDDPADRLTHMEAGFDDTIAKPFTKQQLFESLARLAGRIIKPKTDPKLVLVAEDNAINAQLAYFQLRKLGYEAEIVHNGKEALEAVIHGRYVAVFMDLQMPIMNGIDAVKQIREWENKKKAKHIPIIALTANTQMKDEAMSAGCDYFLSKPAKISDLERALDNSFRNQGIIIPGKTGQEARSNLDFNI